MSKKNLLNVIKIDDEDTIAKAMRRAIDRSRKAEEGSQEPSTLDFHSDFDELEIPVVRKPLFPFGGKALAKIAGALHRSPTVH